MSTPASGSGRSTRARRIDGPTAVPGVAAAVAGLRRYSTFTGSTTPIATAGTSGVLSISLLDADPVVTTRQLAPSARLAAGGSDDLVLTATLPATAGDTAFQDVSSSLSVVFDGVQRAGAER